MQFKSIKGKIMVNYKNLIEKFQNKNFDEQLNFLFQIKQFFEENDKKFFEKNENIKNVVRISAWEDQKQEILNLLINEINIENLKPEHLDLIYKNYEFKQNFLEKLLIQSVKTEEINANANALTAIQWLKNKHDDSGNYYYFYGIGYIKDLLKNGNINFFHQDFLLKVEKILDKDFEKITDFLFEKKITDSFKSPSKMLVDEIMPSLILNYHKSNYKQEIFNKNALTLKNLLKKHTLLKNEDQFTEENFYYYLIKELIQKRYYSFTFKNSLPVLLDEFIGNPLNKVNDKASIRMMNSRINLMDTLLNKINTNDFIWLIKEDLKFLQFLKNERDLFINYSNNLNCNLDLDQDDFEMKKQVQLKGVKIFFDKLNNLEDRALVAMDDLGDLKLIFNSNEENQKKQKYFENIISSVNQITKEIKEQFSLNNDLTNKIDKIFPDEKSWHNFRFEDFIDFSNTNPELSNLLIDKGEKVSKLYLNLFTPMANLLLNLITKDEVLKKYSNQINEIKQFDKHLEVIVFFHNSSNRKIELQKEEKEDLLKEEIEKETKELQKRFSKYKTNMLKQLNNII